MKNSSLALCTGALLTLVSTAAHAQATRTWVSGVGDDANPCSRTAPCLTAAGALSKTAAGGEINIIDQADLGAVTITKSITINGVGSFGGLSTAATAITVNGSGVKVELRNLRINANASGTDGITFVDGASLTVANCSINNFTGNGVLFSPAGKARLSVIDSDISSNGNAGVAVYGSGGSTPATALVSNTSLNSNSIGIWAQDYAYITAANDSVNGNSLSAVYVGTSVGGSEVNVEGGTFTANTYGFSSVSSGSTAATVRLSNAEVLNNVTSATYIQGTGAVHSFGNNRLLQATTLACAPGDLAVGSSGFASGLVGTSYAPVSLYATGAVGTATFGITGSLPPGSRSPEAVSPAPRRRRAPSRSP